jgi:hypothetical protein
MSAELLDYHNRAVATVLRPVVMIIADCMPIPLEQLTKDFADGLKAADTKGPTAKLYKPGIGPFEEPRAVALALDEMRVAHPDTYNGVGPARYPNGKEKCDILVPGEWVCEVKLVRPFGDNGREMEHWSDNLLHPYYGDRSAVGDCLKLKRSAFRERKTILVYGFEHSPIEIDLDCVVQAFELIATTIVHITLGPRLVETRHDLRHQFHQVLRVYAWEIQ